MKKQIFALTFLSLSGILLSGCNFSTIQGQESDKKIEKTDSITHFDCSTPNYYENIQLDKQVSFTWNEEKQAYTVEIPELCIRFISRPHNSTTSNEQWKESTKEIAESGFLIQNNSFETKDSEGNRRINHFLIRNKSESITLDEAIQNDYFIRSNHIYNHEGQKYCYIMKDERSDTEVAGNRLQHITKTNPLESYRLLTLSDILTPEEKQDEFFVSYQFCGSNYPFWWDNFDSVRNNQILYSEQHPERYIIYRVDDNQDSTTSLFSNIEVQFTD